MMKKTHHHHHQQQPKQPTNQTKSWQDLLIFKVILSHNFQNNLFLKLSFSKGMVFLQRYVVVAFWFGF